jgi:hypothetical protein
MTDPNSAAALPLLTEVAGEQVEEQTAGSGPEGAGPTVGASDAEADAARSGADPDADLTQLSHDSDGVPVGEDDLEADKRNSGA